jgi:hypothetical protein
VGDEMRASQKFGGSNPIGSMQLMPDQGGVINLADGSEWLRTGLVASASNYPIAATVESLKVTGNIVTGANTTTQIYQMADNGAGTIVAVTNSTTVLVSTDNGATWATQSVTLGGSVASGVTSVIWNGSRFIVVGNNSSTYGFAYSANGTSWTTGGSSTTTTGAANNVTAKMAWNGSVALSVCSGATSLATTTDGATITSRTMPNIVSAGGMNVTYGGSAFVFHGISTATVYYTTDVGVTNQTKTLPAAISNSGYIGGVWIFTNTSGLNYYTSSDMTNFVTRLLPMISSVQLLTQCSTYVYASQSAASKIYFTSDGINWRGRWLSLKQGSASWYSHVGKYFMGSGSASSGVLRTSSRLNADYVGCSQNVATGHGALGDNSAIGYVRVYCG